MEIGPAAPSLDVPPRAPVSPELRHRPLEAAEFTRAELALKALMDSFFSRYMVRVYREFDGDVVAAIVLGEVAHHNLSAARNTAGSPEALNGVLERIGQPEGPPLLPTNAFSIAQATGIPRETVRRKIKTLVAKGWMAQDSRGSLTVTSAARTEHRALNTALADEVLGLAEAILRATGRWGR